MTTKLTVYEVQPAPAVVGHQQAPPKEAVSLDVSADSHDSLKEAAKLLLTRRGYSVRNVSWAPGARSGDQDRLVAYVVPALKEKD